MDGEKVVNESHFSSLPKKFQVEVINTEKNLRCAKWNCLETLKMEVRVTTEVTVVVIIVVTLALMLIGYFLIGPPGNRRWNRRKN